MKTKSLKPFGWVLKSQTQSNYPWANPRQWSDRADCCGNMRRHIGDAVVYKRFSTVHQFKALDAVPVYSDPRFTGEKALTP